MTNKNFTNPFRYKINQTGSVSPADRQTVLKIFLHYFKNGEISSPLSLLEAFILIGVLAELLVAWLLYALPPMSRLMTLIVDPVLVLLLVTPFYAYLLRPMVLNHDKGKRSQEALQAANTLLERLFSINHILIAYLDPQFRFIRVNLAFAKASGQDPEFFPGKDLFEIYPGTENEPAFKQVLESGKPSFLYDRKYQSLAHPELGATYWDLSMYPVTEAVEGVSGIILSCIDVTERAMAREALHKAYDELEIRVKERTAELAIERSKLNAIIVNAPEGIVVADTQARIILSNPAAERIYGRPVTYGESYENQAALCLCHPDGSPYDPRQLPLTISALDGKALDEIEMCVVWPDGQRRELLVCTAPIRESQGKVNGAVGIYQDITERKQVEAVLQKAYDELELRIQERTREISLANEELILEIAERMRIEQVLASERERLFSLMNEIPLFVTLIGPQYNILFANNAHKNLFGDMDERPCYLSRDNQIVPCEGCQLMKVLETRVPVEWEWTSQGGKSYQIFEYPFTDVDGSELILELGIDRTQRKQMIGQLEQTNQALLCLSQVERNQRLLAEGLIEATLALNSSLNLDDVLDRILDQIQRVIPFDAANISLLEDDHLTVVRQRGYERYPEALAKIDIPFTLDDYPVLHNIEGQPTFILIPDTRREPRWRKSTGLEWVLSCMSAPLMAGSTFLGFLRLYSEQTNNFRQEHIDILNAFTIHATIAIQNARLYEDLTIALEKEQSMRAQLVQNEKLAAIGRTIASVSHELNNPLQTIKN
jgi:PAS domain S-box-containing protein